MSLATPPKVEKLQAALHAKAKRSPDYRFYMLYDKVDRADILAFAYRLCRANGGAPGVDGMTFDDIQAYGEEQWLSELAETLQSLQSGGSTRPPTAPSVVVCQAQGAGCGNLTFPGRLPAPGTGARLPQPANTQLLVGDRVNHLVRKPDAGNPHVRFDERDVETEHGHGH